MKLCFIGAGYVGLVSGICFAEFGNNVICVDRDKDKIDKLNKSVIPIYEQGLQELLNKNVKENRLKFTTDLKYGVENSDIVFIAVGTPSLPDGDVDLSAVKAVAEDIARYINGYKVIVNKSTVPVGTQKLVKELVKKNQIGAHDFDVVSNPEFLREGNAVYDTMNADRVIIGADSRKAADVMLELYKFVKCPVKVTTPESAEMIKYASNAFLATKITFINEIANICEKVGADVEEVAEGMGLDSRISDKFLRAGIGYGGSCFPKDTKAIVKIAEKAGYSFETVKSIINTNERQKLKPVEKLQEVLGEIKGRIIAVLGLAFKPNTDDIREAPSIDIITRILEMGGIVKAFDPVAISNAEKVLNGVEYGSDIYETVKDADAIILVTEWDEFKEIDLQKVRHLVKRPIFIDGRNVFEADEMINLGFEYYCIGRKDSTSIDELSSSLLNC